MSRVSIVTFTEACNQCDSHQVKSSYPSLLCELHGDGFLDWGQFIDLHAQFGGLGEIYFAYVDGVLAGTAQADLLVVAPTPKIHIENVVVKAAFRGQKIGQQLIQHLIDTLSEKWMRQLGLAKLRFELTNSPRKENAGFYKSLGFRPRTEEAGDPTVVWVKEM